jgi:uncharacterized protein YutE (UPF0331/DUF86 family)
MNLPKRCDVAHEVFLRKFTIHLYKQINYTILRDSIAPALEDFRQFVALFETELDDKTP